MTIKERKRRKAKCLICRKIVRLTSLTNHIRWNHKKRPNSKCKFCKKRFSSHNISQHENGCKFNPKNIKRCKTCNEIITTPGRGDYLYCSIKCRKLPQHTKEYWTDKKRKWHGKCIKKSRVWRTAIKNRKDNSGKNNPMYGKKMSVETRTRMSESRKGKTGQKATAWKGGKSSVNSRVKKIIHTRFNWYFRVYARDNFKCSECSSKKRLDAHHKKAISVIIRQLLEKRKVPFKNSTEKVEWLLKQPEIVDGDLKNGTTLCRSCHRKKHGKSWGSHQYE